MAAVEIHDACAVGDVSGWRWRSLTRGGHRRVAGPRLLRLGLIVCRRPQMTVDPGVVIAGGAGRPRLDCIVARAPRSDRTCIWPRIISAAPASLRASARQSITRHI